MTTEDGAIGQVVRIIDRGRGVSGGYQKALAGAHRDMFLQPEERGFIFDHPVGFEIAGELHRFAAFIMFLFLSLAVIALFFQRVVAQGATGRPDQACIHGNSFVDEEPLPVELAQDLVFDCVHGNLG